MFLKVSILNLKCLCMVTSFPVKLSSARAGRFYNPRHSSSKYSNGISLKASSKILSFLNGGGTPSAPPLVILFFYNERVIKDLKFSIPSICFIMLLFRIKAYRLGKFRFSIFSI